MKFLDKKLHYFFHTWYRKHKNQIAKLKWMKKTASRKQNLIYTT